MDLSVQLAPKHKPGLRLANPVMTASGTFGYGIEYSHIFDIHRLGAIICKGTTLIPRDGNPQPRLVETASGMLNSIGLQNDGIDAFITNDIPFLARFDLPVIVSIAATSVDDFGRLTKMLSAISEVDAIELNISCPNAKAGGMIFGSDEKLASEVVSKTKMASSKPVIVKLTPNTSDIGGIARACERAGADALSLINTIYGMAVDIGSFEPRLGSIVGGLSGPAVKPIAVRMVWEVVREVSIPVIGMGGIMTYEDALEFIIAGAVGVAVGTANFVDPQAPIKIIDGINKFLDDRGISSITEVTGALKTNR